MPLSLPEPARVSVPHDAPNELERELVKRLRNGRAALPVLPPVAHSALRLASDPNASVHDLARLVDTEPPIAARFLAVANAAPSFRGQAARSTQVAIVRLGLSTTRDLLFQIVYANAGAGLRVFERQVRATFERSVRTAQASRIVAAELGLPSTFDYMCGLLHDIGESRIYRILDGLVAARVDQAEVAHLVDRYHCEAGAEVAMGWSLPSEIVDACAAHHSVASAGDPAVRLVMVADWIVASLDAASNEHAENPQEDDAPPAHLGLSDEVGARLRAAVARTLSSEPSA